MKKLFSLIAILTISSILVSQNIIITGKAKQQEGSLVRIITYADLFSSLEKTVGETKVDSQGDFALRLDIEETQYSFLALGLERGEFYLNPGSSYSINIPYDTMENRGSIFDRLPLRFSISGDDGGVQKTIEDFNIEFNDFVYNNVNSIYRSRDKSVVTNFVDRIRDSYGDIDSKYVNNYIEYSLASLLWLSKKQSNQKILVNYIIEKPVLYGNVQYVDFFKEFFKSYFDSEKTFRYEELLPVINSKKSVSGLFDLVRRDTILAKDERVSEIVSMLLLSRYYFDRYVNKDLVLDKLLEISKKSKYSENRGVAVSFIEKLQLLENGTRAPEFKLVNVDGDSVSLEDFHGSFVLLSFFKDDCRMCEFHMPLLDELKSRMGFENVIIVAGYKVDNTTSFSSSRGYNWPILKTGDNILIFEDYNIRAYPSYILINPDGTIAYVHLPMPEENMELYIKRFQERYSSGLVE